MAIKLGSAIFEDHLSIELVPRKWTDTFIYPVRYDRALPPWHYAEVVKTLVRNLRRTRRSASLWVPVISPGKWYFHEMKHALRNASMPVAVTCGRHIPQILDFSTHPGLYDKPIFKPDPAPSLAVSDLTENALRCLLVMARFTAAYTNEVKSSLLLGDWATRNALKILAKHGYIEHHPNDGNIDAHLISSKEVATKGTLQGKKWNGDYWPYWRIRRTGISAALRAWGVPVGMQFDYRLERTRLTNSYHRRRSRQWPDWVSMALPHAEIYAGWNEVGVPGLRARPDALACGKIHGFETLFWLEVESGNVSWNRLVEQTAVRWMKAKGYAAAVNVHLIFVVLGTPWTRRAARMAFADVPQTCAVIASSWDKPNFGKLPYPKWGEVVVE